MIQLNAAKIQALITILYHGFSIYLTQIMIFFFKFKKMSYDVKSYESIVHAKPVSFK